MLDTDLEREALTKTVPKVKPTTTANSKEKEAQEKAARLRIVESQVPALAKVFTTAAEKDAQAKQSFFDCFEKTSEVRDKHSFTKEETKALLTAVMAAVYCDGDESLVTMDGNSTAYTMRSKYQTLLWPKTPQAQKEMKKALAKGVDFNNLLAVARGSKTANETKKKGKHGGERKKAVIEDAEEFQNQVSGLINKAWDGEGKLENYEGGLTLDDMEEAFAEIIAGYRAKLDGDGDGDSDE